MSLLSIFDKLSEKVMYKRISCFLSKHKILYKFQFGFRKKHATTHALIDVMDYIYKSLDEGKFVIRIFIDLKKAFDIQSYIIKILITIIKIIYNKNIQHSIYVTDT